jgi:putrescine transport system ATP-binding protein
MYFLITKLINKLFQKKNSVYFGLNGDYDDSICVKIERLVKESDYNFQKNSKQEKKEKIRILDDITLSIYQNEFFSLLGPSGCGKTTLLRIVAGFEKSTSGSLFIDQEDVSKLPPNKRPCNMVFQSYALFPHMTVFQNVAFGLKQEKGQQKLEKSEIKQKTDEVLKLVQMHHLKDRFPNQLSGGQCQRVAIARSLVKKPRVLLLDEPMGALDKKLRHQTQLELINLQKKTGLTFIMVTHDQEEAMIMSSRLAIMNEGKIIQVGTPYEIYEKPNSLFVARFIGDANIFDCQFLTRIDSQSILCSSPDLTLPIKIDFEDRKKYIEKGNSCFILVRPEKIFLSLDKKIDLTQTESEYNVEQGIIVGISYLGAQSLYHVQLPSGRVIQSQSSNLTSSRFCLNDSVYLFWSRASCTVLQS